MSELSWSPHELEPVRGPMKPEDVNGWVESLGVSAVAGRRLAAAGLLTPDVLCGQSVHLQAHQPRSIADVTAGKVTPITGSVWVREQATIHRPMRTDEAFVITGRSAQRFVRKGRRYGVTPSRSNAADGTPLVSNCTTGLLGYTADPALADRHDGVDAAERIHPLVDPSRAFANPSLPLLRALKAGAVFEADPVELSIALMLLRDGPTPTNPIHSDPEQARRAGLAAPIAGGSHVAAFVFEVLMASLGDEVLMHGAHIDLRWLLPTFAADVLRPRATVLDVRDGLVQFDLAVDATSDNNGPTPRLRGSVTIPVSA